MVLSGGLSQTLITSARVALRGFKAADTTESFEAAKLAIRAEPGSCAANLWTWRAADGGYATS
jgi:hypothetical protein